MEIEDDTYSSIFLALKHPIRRRILRMLKEHPYSYTEILNELGIDNGLLNYHLENLRELLAKGEDEKYRLSEFGEAGLSLIDRVEHSYHRSVKTLLGMSGIQLKALLAVLAICIGALTLYNVNLQDRYSTLEAGYAALEMSQVESQRNMRNDVVYETLKMALLEEKIPTFRSLTYNTSDVVLSTALIEDVYVPRYIGSYRIILMSPEEIEALADDEGDFLYLAFTRFDFNSNNILVDIDVQGVFDSGGGLSIGFRLSGTVYKMWIA
jgi:DNA-binding transcriptional ArsR family regulator